jgi:hypothetical protein
VSSELRSTSDSRAWTWPATNECVMRPGRWRCAQASALELHARYRDTIRDTIRSSFTGADAGRPAAHSDATAHGSAFAMARRLRSSPRCPYNISPRTPAPTHPDLSRRCIMLCCMGTGGPMRGSHKYRKGGEYQSVLSVDFLVLPSPRHPGTRHGRRWHAAHLEAECPRWQA